MPENKKPAEAGFYVQDERYAVCAWMRMSGADCSN
jgi:hypothetical protein